MLSTRRRPMYSGIFRDCEIFANLRLKLWIRCCNTINGNIEMLHSSQLYNTTPGDQRPWHLNLFLQRITFSPRFTLHSHSTKINQYMLGILPAISVLCLNVDRRIFERGWVTSGQKCSTCILNVEGSGWGWTAAQERCQWNFTVILILFGKGA